MTEVQPNSHIVEPVTRPDGHTIEILSGDDYSYIRVLHCGHLSIYDRSIVTLIGQGSFHIGLMRIGNRAYNVPSSHTDLEQTYSDHWG